MPVTDSTARHFFTAPAYAVVGASSNTAKYGHKIFAWYLNHDLPVTPLNPASPSVTVAGKDYATLPNVAALPKPRETAVSIITPPSVTLGVLKEAQKAGVPSVWLQPGTFDDEVIDFATAEGNFEAVVYGSGGRGSEGWCVLVDGEKAIKDAGKL
ncbi:hypothetical protein GMORB2_0261 [Geosmithia morbida]|uniref:CoA-binding domain-containing protein n=1 Tax=Geosmithia morbida TaxID=1094350 RepID=A0A9P4Z0W3_9HYPO|nr:uncharacterized protein GMORB2_0261 [Geosmithia morbida]KAF4126525.1 hypothetical protein GMORB2_0261 [Geosmithia morbida]